MTSGFRWIYLIAVVPTATEWLEMGRLPSGGREAVSDIVLTALLLAAAWLACRQHDRIRDLAESDALTGLWNARRFHADLTAEVERAHRQRMPLALAFVDLDAFKQVNDRHGHAVGNATLERFGALLGGALRRHVDRGYRVGGDEFALLLPGARLDEARAIVERVRALALDPPTDLGRFGASVSAGVAELGEAEPPGHFLARADARMYEAKSAGRNRIAG